MKQMPPDPKIRGVTNRFSVSHSFVQFILLAAMVSLAFGQALLTGPSAARSFELAEDAWEHQRWDEAVAGFKNAAALAPNQKEGLEAQLHYAEALSFLTAPEAAISE